MWLPRPVLRRLDPAGARAAVGFADFITWIDWSGVAWLIERGSVHETVLVDGRPVRFTVRVSWDGEPWLSDTWVSVALVARVAGRATRFVHRARSQHWAESLPEHAPSPEPVDMPPLAWESLQPAA